MTDDLRTRIAAALRNMTGDLTYEAMADAVIRELKLTQQWVVDGIVLDGEPRPWELPCETRYVTEWTTDD